MSNNSKAAIHPTVGARAPRPRGQTARALLGNGAEFLHAHFAGPGCFAFRIDRV